MANIMILLFSYLRHTNEYGLELSLFLIWSEWNEKE